MQKTNRGFTYLPVSSKQCISWGGFAVCDFCNTPFEEGYLVFILNSCLCPNCMSGWLKRQRKYPKKDVQQDLAYQEAHQDAWYNWHLDKMKGE